MIEAGVIQNCPEGLLEELQRGLERLKEQRAQEQQKRRELAKKDLIQLDAQEQRALKGKSAFAEAMTTLNRLSSSYRRCYWKSSTEMLFPILFGHMTFASHRCWTVFVKKGVYLAFEARRRAWGDTVRQGAKEAGGGELIHHIRQGLPPFPLVGWRRRPVEGEFELLEGPNGETCATTAEAMSTMLAAQAQRSDAAGSSNAALRWIHEFPTKENGCIKTERLETTDGAPASLEADDATRVVVTTSSLEDWLWRGDDPIVKDMS